jgi:hypothetical protein
MAFKNKEGKSFSSKFRMNRSEKSKENGASHAGNPVESPERPKGEEQDDVESGGTSATDVAAEHGRASEVNVKHDHEKGTHTVNSKHADGHHTQSDHSSAEEAHAHAAQLAGVKVPGEEQGAVAEDDGQDPFSVPGLDS